MTQEGPQNGPPEAQRGLEAKASASEVPAAGAPKAEPPGPRPKPYHGLPTALGGLLFVVLIGLVAMNCGTLRAAQQVDDLGRPAAVPADAVFCAGRDGGHYVSLKRADLHLIDGRRLPAFQVGAWHGLTGDPAFIGTGIFVSDPAMRVVDVAHPPALPAEGEILRSASFDGRELRFDYAGRRQFGRIIALDMPAMGH